MAAFAQGCSRNGLETLLSWSGSSPARRCATRRPNQYRANPRQPSRGFRTLSPLEEEQICYEALKESSEEISERTSFAGQYGGTRRAFRSKTRKPSASDAPWLQPTTLPSETTNDASKLRFDWRERAKSRSAPDASTSKRDPLTKRIRPTTIATSFDSTTATAIERYSAKFFNLLKLEEAEDAASYLHRLSTWPIKRLQDEGYCLTGLTAYWVTDATQYGRPVASFELGPGIKLPATKFTNGSEIFLSRLDPCQETPMVGSVLSTSESAIRVCFKTAFDLDERWRIDMGQPAHIYERMRSAISSFEHDPDELQSSTPPEGGEYILQGTALHDVLLKSLKEEVEHEEQLALADSSVDIDTSGARETQESGCPFKHDGIFKDDHRIQSWARRYARPNPVVVEGDPPLGDLNPSQIQAMAAMVGERFSLIQGPPGTGKTKVIIETIKLLKVHFEVPHPVVVCTYTNVALDNLVDGLVKAEVKPLRVGHHASVRPDLIRHSLDTQLTKHPLSRELLDILEEEKSMADRMDELVAKETSLARKVESYASTDKAPRNSVLSRLNNLRTTIMKLSLRQKAWTGKKYTVQQHMLRDTLNANDVICTTCLTAACHALGSIDFPVVFIDEASMSTEPASLVPIMKGSQHVALIGDHKQLPPIIASLEAKDGGLATSLFERLIDEGHVPSVMLDTQYRMHPNISRFPSKEFYNLAVRDGTVDAGGKSLVEPPSSRHADMTGSTERPAVIFLDHTGTEALKGRSFENVLEAQIVASVVEDLLLSNPQLKATDIGVISPYAAQINLLKSLFGSNAHFAERFRTVLGPERARECSLIEVCTVDGFEGREKQVIIFSTVRNNLEGRIGFLADQKRLNVGLTRAKRGLFVLGSLSTLRAGALAERHRAEQALADAEMLADLVEQEEPVEQVNEEEAPAAKKKAAQRNKPKATRKSRAMKGAESWHRYADFLQESGLIVRLTGPSLTNALHGHSAAAKQRTLQTLIQ